MQVPVIYLDQHMWIDLADVYYGRKRNFENEIILNKLIESSKKGKIIVPLSPIHIIETSKRPVVEARENLINLMDQVSNGYTLPPWYSILDTEIKNVFIRRLGGTTNNVKELVLKKGLTHLLCDELGLKSPIKRKNSMVRVNDELLRTLPISKELKESLLNSYGGVEITLEKLYLKIMDDRFFFKNATKDLDFQSLPDSKKNLDTLEKIGNEIKQMYPDQKSRMDEDFKRDINALIKPRALKILSEMKIPEIVIEKCIIEYWNEVDWFNFAKEIPSFYTFSILSDERQYFYGKKIDDNDLNDLYFLACAIPYCDVIGCDKRFFDIAQKYELDKKYKHIIVHKLIELGQFIP